MYMKLLEINYLTAKQFTVTQSNSSKFYNLMTNCNQFTGS